MKCKPFVIKNMKGISKVYNLISDIVARKKTILESKCM